MRFAIPAARRRRWLVAALGCLVGLAAAGCCGHEHAVQPYLGPTLTMDQLAQRINDNNQKVNSIFSQLAGFTVEFVDDHGASHRYSGDGGLLLYLKPGDLYLRGDSPFGSEFEIGTTADTYWLKIVRSDMLWHGTYAHFEEARRQLPIEPRLLLEVLAAAVIDSNFLQPPVPVMRFDVFADAYVLVWNVPLPDRWVAQKEIWYDRQTLNPTQVRLYDANGRMSVQAKLSEHQRLPYAQDDSTSPGSPVIATHYDLFFTDANTHLSVSLSFPSQVKTKAKPIPNAAMFEFLVKSLQEPGVSKVIDLDQQGSHGEK